MAVFEPRPSGVGSNRSVNLACPNWMECLTVVLAVKLCGAIVKCEGTELFTIGEEQKYRLKC